MTPTLFADVVASAIIQAIARVNLGITYDYIILLQF